MDSVARPKTERPRRAISVRFNPSLLAHLDEYATLQGTTRTATIESIVAEHLEALPASVPGAVPSRMTETPTKRSRKTETRIRHTETVQAELATLLTKERTGCTHPVWVYDNDRNATCKHCGAKAPVQ